MNLFWSISGGALAVAVGIYFFKKTDSGKKLCNQAKDLGENIKDSFQQGYREVTH